MRIFCGLWLSAFLLVCGCSSPRVATAVTRFPADIQATTNSAPASAAPPTTDSVPQSPPTNIVEIALEPEPAEFALPLVPPATNPPVNIPDSGWVRSDRWLAEHHATDVIIRPGTKSARFAGVANLLGFEPVQRDGAVWIHPLDIRKNIEPLIVSKPALPARTVVIDPGHGGINAGTRAITGNRFEKDFTLDWALRLKSLLETQGWTVFLTRTNDSDLSLSQRVDIAEASKAALFVSLHFNSGFPNQKACGLETYCLTPTGMPSTLVRQYADDPAAKYPTTCTTKTTCGSP